MIFPGRTLIVTVAVLPALIFFLHKVTPSLSEQGQDEFYQKETPLGRFREKRRFA